MPAPLATVDQLQARWRSLSDDEQVRANALLADASLWLRTLRPDVDDRIAAGTLDPDAAVQIVVASVRRAMLSGGDGITQQSQTVGPYQQSTTFANPTGSMYYTAAELVLIDGYRPAAMSMRFSN